MKEWLDELMYQYGDFIRLYLVMLLAILGVFCVGLLVIA